MYLIKKTLFLLFIFTCSHVCAQKGGIDALASQFIKYIRSANKEKVIVFTDKPFYAAGEIIWFKALCLDSLSNRLIRKSKNLYVDLVDDRDSVISQLLLNIMDQNTDGRIILSSSLKEGYYWLRGYTINILKEDSDRIFVKPIYILNAAKPDSRALTANTTKPSADAEDTSAPQLSFFPEGGSIISGTTATIAFLSANARGKPIDVSGYVMDSRGDTVVKFRTTLNGMGKFSFDAFNPRKYFAHILWKNKKDIIYPLPHFNQFASQLSLLDQTNQVFHVRVSLGDSLYKKNKSSYILGISRDSLCFAANGIDMYDVEIPKNDFPRGRATLFLFNEQNEIVSQRNVYVDTDDSCSIAASADKLSYGPREKAKLNISVNSSAGNHSMKSLLVVSVTDDRFTGKIAGISIENLGVWGIELQKQHSTAELDLQMLTQKNLYLAWKYDQDINDIPPANAYNENNLLNIQGTVLDKKNEPLKNYIVNLFSQDNRIFKIDTTDNNGHFIIPLSDYFDGTQFNMKLTNIKGQGHDGKIVVDKLDFPHFNTPLQLKKGFEQPEIFAIRNFKAHRLEDSTFYTKENGMMKPVTVQGQKPLNYDASKRVNQFSTIITSDNFENGDPNVVIDAIRNVPGFNAGVNSMSVGMAGAPGNTAPTMISEGVQPLVAIDGVVLSLSEDVGTFLQSIDPRNIDFIEILKGPQAAMYGMQGAGGAILINTTNTRKQIAQVNDKGLSTIYPKGYFRDVNFPIPDYNKKETKNTYQDERSTLYWNPNIITDNNGKASVSFFAADDPATYSATILGLTESGVLLIGGPVEIMRK